MTLDTSRTTHGSTARLGRSRVDLLTIIAALVLLAGVVQSFAGAIAVGVTWDEPTHVERTQALLDVGWFIPDWRLDEGELDEVSPFVYGPAYSMTAYAVNVAVGNEAPGRTSESAEAYVVRHLTIAVLGLLAILAVGAIAWTISGSRRIGLFGAAALAAIPAWTGHSMFNIKDLPAAAGYTLVTAALVLALAPPDAGPGRRAKLWLVAGAAATGTFFGVGTRLAFWVPIGASVAVYLVLWALQRARGDDPWIGGLIAALGGSAVGLAGIVVLYPRAFARPLEFLTGSVSGSAAYPWDGATLTAGRLLPSLDLPWWYLPVWFTATMPVLLLALALGGLVAATRWLVVRDQGARWWAIPPRTGGGVLVAQQALLLPLAAIVAGSVMYDGFRQHLYVLPATAALAAIGADQLRRWSARRASTTRTTWQRPAATAVLALALLVPTVEQGLLFPYNYTYVNPVAGIGGVDGRWETDYWKASGREAVTRVPQDAELLCSSLVRPRLDRGPFYGPCQRDVSTFEHLRGTAVADGSPGPDAGVWLIGRRTEGNRPPDHCRSVDDVTRWVRGERVVMAYVLVCDPDGF
jgi:hypothetical protein